MNFGDLRTLATMYVPTGKENVIPSARKDLILNQGAKEVAARLELLKFDNKFNLNLDQSSYNIEDEVGAVRYMTPDKPGLSINVGTVSLPEYRSIWPRTEEWMEKNKPDWKNDVSDRPQYYWIKSNKLYIWPAPNATYALINGGWFFYLQFPKPMVDNGNFPFNEGSTEASQYTILSDCILLYFKWVMAGVLGKEAEQGKAWDDYQKEIKIKEALMNRRKDISNTRQTKYQGRKYRASC